MSGKDSKIVLGTAQFGLGYGQNLSEPIPPPEVSEILALAWERGIDALDTAAAYGTAEEVIGAQTPAGARFHITTKISRAGVDIIGEKEVDAARASVRTSLKRLRAARLDGVLFHHVSDLFAPGGPALFRAIADFKKDGIVNRIGVSVYEPEELDRVLADYPIDVVQLPFNVADQRFMTSGHLERLSKRNIQVQVRSVFLQGLLLSDAKHLPARFKKLEQLLAMADADAAALGLSREAFLLHYATMNSHVSSVVIGVDGVEHLRRNLSALEASASSKEFREFSRYAVDDLELIDPRKWSQ